MTTSNMVTKRLVAVGNGAGAVCWGGRTGSPGAGGSGKEPGWTLRVRRRPRGQVGWGGGVQVGRKGGDSGVCRAGGLLPHLPRLLAPLLHISTFHASPPRMPNLAHAICRLSSEIGTGTKAECITCITSPPLPLHEEREGQRAGGQAANPQLSFPSSCSLLPPQSQVLGASWGLPGSSRAGPGGRTGGPILE